MKLIVGLGNPGEQYARTRHNIGFMVIDELASRLGASWKHEGKFKAVVATTNLSDDKVILAKPQTFMNLSGEAVQAIANFYKIAATDVWVISDDLDLPFGRLRIRQGGGAGGHNGLKSLIAHLGDGFVRLRLGIDPNLQIPSESYVLQAFSKEQADQLSQLIPAAAELIATHLTDANPQPTSFDLL